MRKMVVRAGGDGAAKVVVQLRGDSIAASPLGEPVLPMALPLTVQVQAASGACWEATYFRADTNGLAGFSSK
jgi:hypothetical protein